MSISNVTKKAPGEFRLIHYLSFPRGSSVKAGIYSEHTRAHYGTFDDAINYSIRWRARAAPPLTRSSLQSSSLSTYKRIFKLRVSNVSISSNALVRLLCFS